ncbi:MAG: NADPH-dependent glutamate synthase [Nitrospirae bacterium]|nr:NADPH-dependent glutamate synthase [Nitrospirota bacterium]
MTGAGGEKKKPAKIIPHKTPIPEQDPRKRRTNFDEVSLGYTPEQAMVEAGRCLNCKDPKCVTGCPVSVPIPRFIQAIKAGEFDQALTIIRSENLLPAVCGRVCPQEVQCEQRCTLGKKFEPVAIGRLERFIADWSAEQGRQDAPAAVALSGKKVAVVGSGPSGLACAYDLAKLGHAVTIYEALHEAGGVLVYGIPEFRLPKKIVSREIAVLKKMGVEIVTNVVVGKLMSVDELMEDFDACFIGTGAGLPKFMGIEGEHLAGVYSANEFLTRINLMRAYSTPEYDTPIRRGERVAVVGGGNVAIDAARTALRLGARETVVIYRRSEAEMPARREEVHHAKEEGVILELLTSPVRIVGENGHTIAVECVRMELGAPDASGRRRSLPKKGSEFLVKADTVIMAVGTNTNPLVSRSTRDLAVNDCGFIIADEQTGSTSRTGVYAGGDIVTGSATVISALGAGRKAAQAIHIYLIGKSQ